MLSSVHNKARETGVILLGAMMNDIPVGYCQCGCGRKTRIASHTETSKGWVKGEPIKYIQRHKSCRTWEEFIEHFWSQVDIRKPDECWVWQGGLFSRKKNRNYGITSYLHKNIRTHVLAYELTYGPLGDGMKCLHRCDNPPCCNPHHLFVGTDRDNVLDKIAKGRHAKTHRSENCLRGSDNNRTKLTEPEVREIKKLLREGNRLCDIALTFKVCRSTIASIRDEKTWKHLK